MSALPINIGDLSILVHGYEFPDIQDYWGGNWLEVDVWCESQGKRVGFSGRPCLRVSELAQFRRELKKLAKQRRDTAGLKPLEPYLGVKIRREAITDRISVSVSMRLKQSKDIHSFQFTCDVQQVNGWIGEINAVLKAFPQRGDISNVH